MVRIQIVLIAAMLMSSSSIGISQENKCNIDDLLQPGDANKDLQFDTKDLVLALEGGKFETGDLASWEEGDWNFDGVFDSSDLSAAWNTGNYEQGPYAIVAPGPAPTPRGGAPAVWLPFPGTRTGNCLLLFGGMDPITGDTHTFGEGKGWVQLLDSDVTAPSPRCHHTLVSDRFDGAILFGGFSREKRFNDTYSFDPTTGKWTEWNTSGEIPGARCLHASVVMPSTNEMMVYGGIRGAGRFGDDFFLDTSLLDLSTKKWQRVNNDSPPGGRAGAIVFYSSKEDAVFLWGGLQIRGTIRDLSDHFIGYLTELWKYDPHNRTWSTVEVTGEIPIGREDPTYFWDEMREKLYLFHGYNSRLRNRLLDDAFVLDVRERRWERLQIDGDVPSTRWRGSVAFDPLKGDGWLFGGWLDFGTNNLNDTWRFDVDRKSWIKVCIEDN